LLFKLWSGNISLTIGSLRISGKSFMEMRAMVLLNGSARGLLSRPDISFLFLSSFTGMRFSTGKVAALRTGEQLSFPN